MNQETILLAFVVVTGLAILLQTIILLAIFVSMRKTVRALRAEVEDLRSSVLPTVFITRDLVINLRELISRLSPKIENAVDDLTGIAHSLRTQTAELQSSASEVVERLRKQALRLDNMIGSVLDGADRAGGYVVESIGKPVRQLSGLLASVKAFVGALHTPAPRRP
jgi:methyl-accepting chemotaxis protein